MPETWQGELCTPTGAALLTHFVTKFGPMPVMQVEKIGYGMGKKGLPGGQLRPGHAGPEGGGGGYRLPAGMQPGRHDPGGPGLCPGATVGGWGPGCVYGSHRDEKSRPGVLLACLCREEDAGKLAEAILRHTTTLGVRRMSLARTLRPRSFRTVQTPGAR